MVIILVIEMEHKSKSIALIMEWCFFISCLVLLMIGLLPIYEGLLHEQTTSIMLMSLAFAIPQLFAFEPLLKIFELIQNKIIEPSLTNEYFNKKYRDLSEYFNNKPYNVGIGITIIIMAYILIARTSSISNDSFGMGLFIFGMAFYFNDIYQWFVVQRRDNKNKDQQEEGIPTQLTDI